MGRKAEAKSLIQKLEDKYVRVLTDLYPGKEVRDRGRSLLRPCFTVLKSKLDKTSFTQFDDKEILAQGELMSTAIFTLQCEVRNLNTVLLPALDFMRINEKGEPNIDEISKLVLPIIAALDDEVQVIVTQGFICRNKEGNVDNLNRGGSDYTATIIGAAVKAREVQIWTDIDGVHNNDPRLVENTSPIRNLSYREAAELAYFGAKILHPTCVLPVEKANVPLRLKCTMEPMAPGTLITEKTSNRAITAVAAKDNITAIKIYSHRMLQSYGFLKKIFAIFEEYHTSVDMITTSEVAVSLTIDETSYLDQILASINQFAEIEAVNGYSIVCVVGNALYDDSVHIHRIFESLKDIPIRMVSMGGSRHNVSLLVKTAYKDDALIALNGLFENKEEAVLEEMRTSLV